MDRNGSKWSTTMQESGLETLRTLRRRDKVCLASKSPGVPACSEHILGGLGIGLIENILEAYNFLANNYRAGDQLFFFGFSRGAYTVRATAGPVCQLGVLKPAAMPVFISNYNVYIHRNDGIEEDFTEYPPWKNFSDRGGHVISPPADIKIQVIGVWDTVGALGIPDLGHWFKWYKADKKAYQFYDTSLNDSESCNFVNHSSPMFDTIS